MTSAINPNNIDGSYPVAGQDNNSQGFRDNFTNIKVNFQYAAEEIDDLQSKVLLKAALTGTSLNNNMSNNTIYAVNLNDVSTTVVPITATSGAIAINYVTGQYQTIATTTGSVTLSFTNFPADGFYGSVRLAITISNTGYTLSLPGTVTQGITGIQGYSAGTITFAATGTYVFDFSTSNGGASYCITDLSRPLTAFPSANITGGTVSATGNITGGNILSTGAILANSTSAGVGYATGAGSTVAQGTNRATAVTLNRPTGQITLVSAAGNTTPTTFTLNNTTIAATDVLLLNQKSGTNIYNLLVSNVVANSASITAWTTGGTTTEAPVINFAVIKGVAA
jgi:hypothetical protein